MAKRFTEEDREKAVNKAQRTGNYDKVAQDLGITKATLKRWESDLEKAFDNAWTDIDEERENVDSGFYIFRGIPKEVRRLVHYSIVIIGSIFALFNWNSSLMSDNSTFEKIIGSFGIATFLVALFLAPYLRITY